MLWVKLGTHITDHERFFDAGPVARDLWAWGMLYAGKHETDGELPMSAVLSTPWGAGGKANIKVAEKLVTLGLWRRTDKGWAVCRWAEQGNETKESLRAKREAGRQRKAASDGRKRESNGVSNGVTPPVSNAGSNAFGSTSTSLSDSGSLSGSQIASPPKSAPRAMAPVVEPIGEAPDLTPSLRAVVAQVAEPAGVTLDADHEWLTYVAHCGREARQVTAPGWKYWLCNAAKFAKRDRVRDSARGAAGRHIVQSGDNRAWKLPEGLE